MVDCPICGRQVRESLINQHIDSSCKFGIADDASASTASPVARTPGPKSFFASSQPVRIPTEISGTSKKRSFTETLSGKNDTLSDSPDAVATVKKSKNNAFEKAAPLAERMRPKSLDDVCGQELVGVNGVLRGLIEQNRVPSMILWGSAGTGKTTIARLVANQVNARFVEINASEAGVAEVKKIFSEAKSELGLTGRRTIIFCDEIHRFSKNQQDVFLGPVEAGIVTLIGATTENPSFKVQNALLSRCRTFTLSKLSDSDIEAILFRALEHSKDQYKPNTELVNEKLLHYLAAFSDGDARTALNLLELAMDLASRPNMDVDTLKSSLTKTLVYDRAGDQHYDTISAFHKAVRGSDADAALYYLARMIQSGEDALYIARRMVVIASEDVGLADNNMLSLATSTYSACEKIGLPECRINLAHCAVALSLSPKSTRAYRGLKNAMTTLKEPGVAGLPIPIHLRNAPTKLMKELGYGKEYKYNPQYVDGKVKQDYLPEPLLGRTFLEDRDLGTEVDGDLDSPATIVRPATSDPPVTRVTVPALSARVKTTDPVIQMLARRAVGDSSLKELMKLVANSRANPAQLQQFQAHIDEFDAIMKKQKAEQQAIAGLSEYGLPPLSSSAPQVSIKAEESISNALLVEPLVNPVITGQSNSDTGDERHKTLDPSIPHAGGDAAESANNKEHTVDDTPLSSQTKPPEEWE